MIESRDEVLTQESGVWKWTLMQSLHQNFQIIQDIFKKEINWNIFSFIYVLFSKLSQPTSKDGLNVIFIAVRYNYNSIDFLPCILKFREYSSKKFNIYIP